MNKRLLWVDVLRIIGMFGVIIIHIADNTLYTLGLSGGSGKNFEIICKSCYFALPLFVMISGMLLLNKDIDYKKIFFKYIRRMLLVLIVFGGIFAFMEEYFVNRTINVTLFINIIKRIFTGNLWAHMWYIYLVIALYLITPVLRKWVKNTSNKEQLIFLIVLYIFTILSNEIGNLIGYKTAFYIPIGTGFVFVYLLGNYIYNNKLSSKLERLLYVLGIISFITIILLTYFGVCKYLVGYTSTLCIIVAISVFYLFKDKKITGNQNLSKLIINLGECSFGIYIIHQLFINIIYKILKIDMILYMPYLGMILYVLGVLVISFISIYVLRKINFVKKYIL